MCFCWFLKRKQVSFVILTLTSVNGRLETFIVHRKPTTAKFMLFFLYAE